jgi:hypothetical protein
LGAGAHCRRRLAVLPGLTASGRNPLGRDQTDSPHWRDVESAIFAAGF